MMPSEYRLESLPEPKEPRVHLHVVAPRRFAAVRYSGTWSQKNYQQHLEQLRTAMRREGRLPRG
jgi:hypothetical protein